MKYDCRLGNIRLARLLSFIRHSDSLDRISMVVNGVRNGIFLYFLVAFLGHNVKKDLIICDIFRIILYDTV